MNGWKIFIWSSIMDQHQLEMECFHFTSWQTMLAEEQICCCPGNLVKVSGKRDVSYPFKREFTWLKPSSDHPEPTSLPCTLKIFIWSSIMDQHQLEMECFHFTSWQTMLAEEQICCCPGNLVKVSGKRDEYHESWTFSSSNWGSRVGLFLGCYVEDKKVFIGGLPLTTAPDIVSWHGMGVA